MVVVGALLPSRLSSPEEELAAALTHSLQATTTEYKMMSFFVTSNIVLVRRADPVQARRRSRKMS